MPHLSLEALARLVDEPPAAAEADHVRDCLVCRREVEELRAQTRALAALPELAPSPAAWGGLEAALRAEGLIRDLPRRAWYSGRAAARIAAAVAIFLLGGAAGLALWGGGGEGSVAVDDTGRGARAVDGAAVGTADVGPPPLGSASAADEPLILIEDAPQPVSAARLASTGSVRGAASSPPRVYTAAAMPAAAATVSSETMALDAAGWELVQAEVAYLAALHRYVRAADEPGSDPRVRLAALDRLVAATSAALERSPDDAVVNGYHLAAVRERDGLRRELAQAQKNWF